MLSGVRTYLTSLIRGCILVIFILSFQQSTASQLQSVTADGCLKQFGALNGSSLRGRIQGQPESAVKCVDALLNGYAWLEVESRTEEAALRLRLAERLARAYLTILHNPMLARQIALYRGWSMAQKRQKVEADAQWYVGNELQSKGDFQAALKIWLEGVEVYRRLGDRWGEASSLDLIAVTYNHLKRPKEALEFLRRSLDLNRRLGYTAGSAANLLHIGAIYEPKKQDEAIELYLQAVRLSRKAKDVRGEINALSFLADLYLNLNQPQEAANYYKQLLAVSNKSRHMHWYFVAKTLLKMGGLFLELNLQQEADTAMQQLDELLREAALDGFLRGQVLTDAAELYQNAGHLNAALKFYEKVLAAYGEGKNDREIGDTHNRIGVLYKNQSLYGNALKSYTQAFDAYERAGARLSMAYVANNIGIVMDRQGYYKEALKFYGRALGTYEEAIQVAGKDEKALSALNTNIADTEINVGITLLNLGQDETALRRFQKVEKQYNPPSSYPGFANLTLNIGSAYTNLNRYDDAERYFKQALTAYEGAHNQVGVANVLTNRGTLLYERGQYLEARKLYEQALEIHRKYLNRKEAALLLYGVARTYMQSAEYDEALLRLTIALKISQVIGDPEISWRTNSVIASCLEKTNRPLEALESYKASITDIESLRTGIGNSRRDVPLKIDFFMDKLQPYASIVKLLLKLSEQTSGTNYRAQAFEYADRAKGRGLLDLLAESQALEQVGAPAELARRVDEGNDLVTAYEGSLRLAKSRPLAQRNQKLIEDYELLRTLAVRAQRSAQEELEQKYPRYVELTNPQPVTVAQIQGAMLREREVLIEYLVTSKETLAFLVSKTEVKAVTLKIGEEELYRQVIALRRSLVKVREYDAQTAHQLYEKLFRPLEAYIDRDATVYIVPDASLHYLPFDALLTSAEPSLRYSSFLLNKYRFAYVPSAGVLGTVLADAQRRRAASPPQHPLVVFANPDYGQEPQRPGERAEEYPDETWDDCQRVHFAPLPHTEEEAKSIGRAFDTDLDGPAFNVRGRASESRVKSLDLSGYRFVHFATHGLVCEQDSGGSLQPSLVLSLTGLSSEDQKAGNDGFLQMDEILNLKLNADLVTLSACRTILGRDVEGEGLIALTRAFMYAGTPSVLVSQWNVADQSTSMFMNRFYSNLRDGMKKGEALHEAKRWMLENSSHVEVQDGFRNTVAHDHPYFWAPFVLVGASE